MQNGNTQYVGFWPRVLASLIDGFALLLITSPLILMIYGTAYGDSDALIQGPADLFISVFLPAVLCIGMWTWKQATPGKMVISAKIVDAETGEAPSLGQNVARYLGSILSMMCFGLGALWVAFDPRKQGWHDKIAGTLVVRSDTEQAPQETTP